MVRETRFAFDNDPRHAPQISPDDFTEQDDLLLDDFIPPSSRDPAGIRNPGGGKQSNQIQSTSHSEERADKRRHLADADWLAPPVPSRSRRRNTA